MVFSINPTDAKTHAQFQANAIQQNGTGAGSAITGNAPAADPNAAAGAGAAASASASASASAASSLATPPGAAQTGVAQGTGQVAGDGSCLCAVQCSFSGFPNGQVQGRDSFGGFGGESFLR